MSKEKKILSFCKKEGWVSRTASDLKICDDKTCPSCYEMRLKFPKKLEELLVDTTVEPEINKNFQNISTCQKKK